MFLIQNLDRGFSHIYWLLSNEMRSHDVYFETGFLAG